MSEPGAAQLAIKIAKKAEDSLSSLLFEMEANGWPVEFRVIMWGAVADYARRMEIEARMQT